MISFRKIEKKFTAMPLFFQVFAIACSLMFALAAYGFSIEAYSEARVFLYSGLTAVSYTHLTLPTNREV